MKRGRKENGIIAREMFKNIVMGNSFLTGIRNKIASGRTTGALDIERSHKHVLSIFEQYTLGLKDAGLSPDYFKGKTILEIGPGSNLGVELCFIGKGAKRAYALDRFKDVQSTPKVAELYERIIQQMPEEEKVRVKAVYKTEKGLPVIDENMVSYLGECALEDVLSKFKHPSGNCSLKVDVVVSHLALEHVAKLSKGIFMVSQMLNPGGICIFTCNLKSLGGVYMHHTEPLRLLNYSESLWQKMFSERGGSNRVRAFGYRKRLEVNNFSILSFEVLEKMSLEELDKIRWNFDRKFRSLSNDELCILKFRIVGKLLAKN